MVNFDDDPDVSEFEIEDGNTLHPYEEEPRAAVGDEGYVWSPPSPWKSRRAYRMARSRGIRLAEEGGHVQSPKSLPNIEVAQATLARAGFACRVVPAAPPPRPPLPSPQCHEEMLREGDARRKENQS